VICPSSNKESKIKKKKETVFSDQRILDPIAAAAARIYPVSAMTQQQGVTVASARRTGFL